MYETQVVINVNNFSDRNYSQTKKLLLWKKLYLWDLISFRIGVMEVQYVFKY